MKRCIAALSLVMWWQPAAWAQLRPPNEAGVTMGQIDALVQDVDAAKKFWTLMGATPVKVGRTEAMKFPGVFVFLKQGVPSGGTTGTPVDHIGFWVNDGPAIVAKLKAAGVRTDPDAGVKKPGLKNVGNVYTAENLKIEILEDKDQTAAHPIVFDHIHYAVPAPPDGQSWFMKTFGTVAIPDPRNQIIGGFAGTRILFMRTAKPLSPTKGRAVDYVGFEVKNLRAFCKKLEADGVKFDEPYSKSRHKGFASAKLTDPWGMSIELTEGLSRF